MGRWRTLPGTLWKQADSVQPRVVVQSLPKICLQIPKKLWTPSWEKCTYLAGEPSRRNIPTKRYFSALRNKTPVTPLRVSPIHINRNHLCKCWLFSSYLEDKQQGIWEVLGVKVEMFFHCNSLGGELPTSVTCCRLTWSGKLFPGDTSRKDILHQEP